MRSYYFNKLAEKTFIVAWHNAQFQVWFLKFWKPPRNLKLNLKIPQILDAKIVLTISLPHSQYVTQYIKPLFHANNCRLAIGSNSTIRRKVVSNRPLRGAGASAGAVYQIPCSDCDKSYYGQSGRGFDIRLREHQDAVRLRRANNACFKHSIENNHNLDWDNYRILYKSDDLTKRLVVESSLIISRANFNNTKSTLSIENLAAKIILNSQPNMPPPD